MIRHRLLVLLLAASIPALLAVKVWQVQRTQALLSRMEAMDREQREWLEKNKRLLSAIAVFRSPARIEKLAREKLGLQAGVEPDLRIEVGGGGE
jgi:cell division protein FtsL